MLIHGPRLVFQFNLAFKIVCQTFTKWFMFINMPFDLPNGIWKKCWYFVAISRAQLTINVSKILSRLSRDLRDCRTMWMGHSFFSIHNLRMRSFHNEVTNFREKQIWLQAGSLRLTSALRYWFEIPNDRSGSQRTDLDFDAGNTGLRIAAKVEKFWVDWSNMFAQAERSCSPWKAFFYDLPKISKPSISSVCWSRI